MEHGLELSVLLVLIVSVIRPLLLPLLPLLGLALLDDRMDREERLILKEDRMALKVILVRELLLEPHLLQFRLRFLGLP